MPLRAGMGANQSSSQIEKMKRMSSCKLLARFRELLRVNLRGLHEGTGRARRDSTVHKQSLPGHIAAGLRSEENNRRIQIIGLPGSLERNAVTKVIEPLFILIKDLVLFGAKPARSQAIDRHGVPAPIIGQAHC